MSIRRPKGLIAGPLGSIEPFALSEGDWSRIEGKRVYGNPIPTAVREAIVAETVEYLGASRFERAAPPIADASNSITKIRKATEQLSELLQMGPARVDGAHYARHLIMNHLDDSRLGKIRSGPLGKQPPNDPLTELLGVLQSCLDACDSAEAELANSDYSQKEGEAWRKWIGRLCDIFEGANLPDAISNDENKKQSPFVMLVQGLQSALPTEHRRHAHSNFALAKAMTRARRAWRKRRAE